MIDYDKAKRIKEIYQQVEEFDKKWLGARGVFNVLHKVGAISDDDHKAVIDEYDRVMAPVHKLEEKAKGYVIDHAQRLFWNTGLMKRDEVNNLLPPSSKEQPKDLSFFEKVKSLFQ